MAWCWPGNKPLSEPMVVSLLMHICFPQPQWVNLLAPLGFSSNFQSVILGYILPLKFTSTSCKIILRWMSQNTFDDTSTMVLANGLVPSDKPPNVDPDPYGITMPWRVKKYVNSSPSSDAYMQQWIRSALLQIIACQLFSANAALSSIGLLGTNFNEIWIRIISFSLNKMHLKMSSAKMAAILFRGRWVKAQTKWPPICHG